MARSKKLNTKTIGEMANKKFKKGNHKIKSDDQELDFEFDLIFRDSKIEEYILGTMEDIKLCDELGINVSLFFISNMNLIKHFTSIPFPSDINRSITQYINMCDIGITDEIVSLFDKNEVSKINSKIENAHKLLPKAAEMLKKSTDEMLSLVESEDDQ